MAPYLQKACLVGVILRGLRQAHTVLPHVFIDCFVFVFFGGVFFGHKFIWEQISLGRRICPLRQEFFGIDSYRIIGSEDIGMVESFGSCGDCDFESLPIPVACQGPWFR